MAYLGVPPFGQTVRTVTTITATGSQTSFTPNGGYTAGYVDVYYNGIKLVAGVDFTASNGSTVVLTTGATANAVVEIVAYGSVSLADSVRRSGDTFSGTVNFPNNNIIAANGFIGIGNTIPNAPLVIGSASGAFTNPLVQAAGSANSWVQISAQNLNNGNNASTDLVLGRSDGNDVSKYIDIGINSNTYAQAAYSIMTPGSGYVFVNGGDLSLGTQTNNSILFHTGDTTAAAERVRIDTAGNLKLSTSGTKILNSSGNPILQQSGSIVQTQYVSSGTRVSTTHSGSFAEPSTAYRVNITPTSASSMIILNFYVPLNQNSAANILTVLRTFRSVGGTKAYNLTSAGATNGSRNVVAGGTFRPQNGYDNNDMDMKCWQVIDFPGTTSTVTYGFESKPESTNTTAWGYSLTDSSAWGWDADVVIIAQEIAQ